MPRARAFVRSPSDQRDWDPKPLAITYFQVTSLSRADGRSAPAAAAYRSGERLRDEGRNQIHNHSKRNDIEHREIILPTGRSTAVPDWVSDRNRLWNAAEAVETRANARVAREYVVALPHELSLSARTELARRFAQDIADRYGTAIDLATHQPRSAGDPRNFHAHLLSTTREITSQGLGAKSLIEQSDSARRGLGLQPARDEIRALRSHWTERANEMLLGAGLDVRLDPRTLKAQGLDRIPQAKIPMAVIQMERRGIATDFMRQVREWDRQALAVDRTAISGREANERNLPTAPQDSARKLSLSELQAQAREQWLAYRAEQAAHRGHPDGSAQTLERIRQDARSQWLQYRERQLRPGPELQEQTRGNESERAAATTERRTPGLEWGD